jgi:hypothetical protein
MSYSSSKKKSTIKVLQTFLIYMLFQIKRSAFSVKPYALRLTP